MTPGATSRRLTLADLAILVAASAFAIFLVRLSWGTEGAFHDWRMGHSADYQDNLRIAPFKLAPALAFLAARMIPPRPRWRVIFRQPGTWACLAIWSHLVAIIILNTCLVTLLPRFRGWPLPNFNAYLDANRECGAWVGVAWATLKLSGAWRAEASWIDRAGRILGVVAIIHWVLSMRVR